MSFIAANNPNNKKVSLEQAGDDVNICVNDQVVAWFQWETGDLIIDTDRIGYCECRE